MLTCISCFATDPFFRFSVRPSPSSASLSGFMKHETYSSAYSHHLSQLLELEKMLDTRDEDARAVKRRLTDLKFEHEDIKLQLRDSQAEVGVERRWNHRCWVGGWMVGCQED